jgi:hypothetical protein
MTHAAAWVTMQRAVSLERRGCWVRELIEMTIGRTEDPENPLGSVALEVASLFGTGSWNPSGPAVIAPRQKAGHMIAVDPHVSFLIDALEPRGRPHMDPRPLN